MKLFEHPEFEQLVLRANEHFRSRRLRPAIIEKDCRSDTTPETLMWASSRSASSRFCSWARLRVTWYLRRITVRHVGVGHEA